LPRANYNSSQAELSLVADVLRAGSSLDATPCRKHARFRVLSSLLRGSVEERSRNTGTSTILRTLITISVTRRSALSFAASEEVRRDLTYRDVAFRLEQLHWKRLLPLLPKITRRLATEALLFINNRLLGHLNVELKEVKNVVSENLLLSFVSIVSYLLDF